MRSLPSVKLHGLYLANHLAGRLALKHSEPASRARIGESRKALIESQNAAITAS